MSNSYFQFKQFIIHQDRCAMKVTTDACLFGAWVAMQVGSHESGVNRILDIGAGTGLLSLMLAQKLNAFFDSIEIDKDAYEQAKDNIEASLWNKRINIFPDDTRSFEFPYQYDVIISNPPFYENELKSGDLKRNLALHSDKLSLDELLQVIRTNLSPSGVFFLLLPYKRQDEIRRAFQKNALSIQQIIFVRQSVKHDYFRMMIMGKIKSDESVEITFDEISIWDENQQYTKQFVELLKDYYLYL